MGMAQLNSRKHSGATTGNSVANSANSQPEATLVESSQAKAIRILDTPPRRRQQQTKLFHWVKSHSNDSVDRQSSSIEETTPVTTKRTILGPQTSLENCTDTFSPMPLPIHARRRVKRIVDSPEPESDEDVKETRRANVELEAISSSNGTDEENTPCNKRVLTDIEPMEVDSDMSTHTNQPNQINYRKRRLITRDGSIVQVDMANVEETATAATTAETAAETTDKIVMEIDSDSENDSNAYEENGSLAESEDPTVFFNSASSQELQEILRISEKQSKIIIEHRPYTDTDHLYTTLSKTRGVSPQLITRYEELIEGYEAVDKLIEHCQNESRRVIPPTLSKRLFDEMAATKQPAGLAAGFQLKGYQIAGVQWLLSLYKNKLKGGILADEMGLGKTAQVISFISELKDTLNEPGPHLIIVPSSTLDNWSREFDKFCPGLRVVSYYGTQAERAELRDEILGLRGTDDIYNAVISTYAVATSDKYDRLFMRKMQFKTMILDEGHLVKNFTSDRYTRLMQINVSFRLLLTGTPLQNNLQELLSILTFVMPLNKDHDLDAMRSVFRPAHVSEVDGEGKRTVSKYAFLSNHRMERAKLMLNPFILRRRKIQVLKDLPKKKRQQIQCSMTPFQRRVYAWIDRKSRDECLQEISSKSNQSSAIIQLRKAACHPLLFRTLYTDDILSKMATELLKEPDYYNSEYQYLLEDMQVMSDSELHQLCKKYKYLNSYQLSNQEWMDAGKIKEMCDIIDKAKAKNDRVLVFSQFTMVLDILEWVMETRNEKYLRLDGGTKVDTRQDMLDTFARDTTISVFLLSTKAGGFGLNITTANIVVLYDPDFNPHNDRQAEDRAHRVGQTKDVMVYKLISRGTIEEYMIQCAKLKLQLDQNIRNHSRVISSDAEAASDDSDRNDVSDDDGDGDDNSNDDDTDASDEDQQKISDAVRMTSLRKAWLASQVMEE